MNKTGEKIRGFLLPMLMIFGFPGAMSPNVSGHLGTNPGSGGSNSRKRLVGVARDRRMRHRSGHGKHHRRSYLAEPGIAHFDGGALYKKRRALWYPNNTDSQIPGSRRGKTAIAA